MLLFLIPINASHAQTQLPGTLALQDQEKSFNASSYAYVTPDPGGRISYRTLIDNFNAGQKGERIKGSVLNLGSSGTPHWIVIVLQNDSWTDNWILSFGQHMDGRIGMLKDISVYENITNTRYLDTISAAQNPYISGGTVSGSAVKVNLPKGKRSVFVIYAVPHAGHIVTLVPTLTMEKAFMDNANNPYRIDRMLGRFMMVMLGLFGGALLFGRAKDGWIFLAYFLLQYELLQYQNNALFTDNPMAGQMPQLLLGAIVIISLLSGKIFLNIKSFDAMQYRILIAFMALAAAAVSASVFFLPANLPLRILGIVVPMIGGISFLTMLSFAQAYKGQYGARQFGVAWLCMLAGLMCNVLALSDIIPATPSTVAAYWYAILPQGILFVTANFTKFFKAQRQTAMKISETDSESESFARLRQSKEASEINRLKRLIEHEREVMNSMREREVQQNEEMRSAKEGADEANRAKSAFLAVISHEIRTPMSGIMGMVRLLLESKLNKEQLDYAQTIQDSGDAMLSLLNDILDFEKIESGKMELEHIDFDLHRIINSIVTLMSGHATGKGLVLKADMDANVPRYVIGDPVRLRQVLLNLTGNSIKFTQNGSVTLRVKLDPTADTRSGTVHRIRFAVEDTGVGISKEAQKNLFNPFAQADSSTARKFGGTGLGLAISQRLIEAMGGKIHIDSTEGHGSIFFFTLIVENGSAEAVDGRAAKNDFAGAPEKSLNILGVEDNEINQKLLKEFVQRLGHKITLCGSGEQALEMVATESFDMILMDVNLPGLSGMGTTKAIRAMKDRKKAATPIIALTGKSQDSEIRMCYTVNMNGHMVKPVDPKRLKGMIEKVITNKLDNPVELPEESASGSTVRVVNPVPAPAHVEIKPAIVKEEPQKEPVKQEELKTPGLVLPPMSDMTIDLSLEGEEEPVVKSGHAKEAFDEVALSSLKGAMPADDLKQMVDGLFDKIHEIVTVMTSQTSAENIALQAHDLKGMAGNFGLKEMSDAAIHIEKFAVDHDINDMREWCARLPAIAQRSQEAVQSWLQE